MKLILYTDGGARGNPGPAAIGVVLMNEKKEVVQEHKSKIGVATNNVAEYTAMIKGLELAKKKGATEIFVSTDSQLMCNQLNGSYKVKALHLKPLFEAVKKLLNSFKLYRIRHVRRENPGIVKADALVNAALDGY